MTTKLNINISGFDLFGLKQSLEDRIEENRKKQLEQERIREAQRQAEELRRKKRALEGKDENGSILDGQAYGVGVSALFADEVSSRRKKQVKIGHLWVFEEEEEFFNDGVSGSEFGGFESPIVYTDTKSIGKRFTTRLYCGNGSKNIEFTHGLEQQQMIPLYSGFEIGQDADCCIALQVDQESRIQILPAGRDRFIVFFFSASTCVAVNDSLAVVAIPTTPELPYPYAFCEYPDAGPAYNPIPGNPIQYRDATSFSTIIQSNFVRKCFVCSNTNIEEIPFPTAMSPLLDEIAPPFYQEEIIYPTGFVTGLFALIVAKVMTPVTVFSTALESKGLSANTTTAVTPETYDYVTNYDNAAYMSYDSITEWRNLIGDITKQYPVAQSWILTDTSFGAYQPAIWWTLTNGGTSDVSGVFNSSEQFYYGLWNTPNQEPTYTYIENETYEGYLYDPASYARINSATHSMSSSRYVPSTMYGKTLYTVWDWNDPSYCRTVYIALGFTDQDVQI